MKERQSTPPQGSLLLRLLGGGYLVYLAYDLFRSGDRKIAILIAACIFALVGGALFLCSLVTLIKSDYFRNLPAEEEQAEDNEE